MLNLVIFGAPGSGKGTQSDRLIDEYGLFHISTGEVLRNHIALGTELGKIADSYISKGCLIPDDLMIKILSDVLDSNKEKVARGVIFDGFPRTIAQAEALDAMLGERGSGIDAVVGLEVDENELIDRLLKRGQREGRSDDNLDTIKNRLDVYHNSTHPLRNYYIDKGKYHAIKGSGTIDGIYGDIKNAIGHLDLTPNTPEEKEEAY